MSKFPATEAPDEVACSANSEQVLRVGVESLRGRDEAEKVWLDYARDNWRSGKKASEHGEAVEMDDAQFGCFCDKILEEVRP
jgi:hypothetical protein